MKKVISMIACLCLLCGICCAEQAASTEQINGTAEENGSSAQTFHVYRELSSMFLDLIIDADVTDFSGISMLPVFISGNAEADDNVWKEMFFDTAEDIEDGFQGFDDDSLWQQMVYDRGMEHAYSQGSTSTRYQAYFCAFTYRCTDMELIKNMPAAVENIQAESLNTTPAQAMELAQSWIRDFEASLGWGKYRSAQIYALPEPDSISIQGEEDCITTGMYCAEFENTLEGIPIACDLLPYTETEGDVLRIYIDDSGILLVEGVCRQYRAAGSAELNVSVEQALDILYENMDYAKAYPADGHGFLINQVELCYRLVPALEYYDKDYYAVMTARPAWRFASGVCRNQTDVFVMFIDAETGEVLQ